MVQFIPSPARPGISRLHPPGSRGRCSTVAAKALLPVFLLLILAVPFNRQACAASDDYLKAIDAEGNRLEFLGQAKKEHEMLMRSTSPARDGQKPGTAQKKTARTTSAAVPAPSPDIASRTAVSRAEFEQALKKNFPGSFALYSLLEPQEKEAVFHEYENANSGGTIRFLPAVSKIISFNSMANKAR